MLRWATFRPLRCSARALSHSNNHDCFSSRRTGRNPVQLFSRSFSLPRFANLYKFGFPKLESLPLDVPIDEENVTGYRWETYYHPNPGEILYGRYEMKVKIGYGSSSIVWLALDLAANSQGTSPSKKYVAIKIIANNYEGDDSWHEMAMSHHIATSKPYNPYQKAHQALLTATSHFIIPTRRGSHLCMVFDPMREPLWMFQRRLSNGGGVTQSCLPILKRHLRTILAGLEYLHSECKIIHTDLKTDNILMTFEDDSVLEKFVQEQAEHPMPRKILEGRVVYRCQSNFGDVKDKSILLKMTPKLADFGLAQDGSRPGPFINPIQPNRYHAPEVLLGTGWSYSADIWNFAILVWDLLTGQTLFFDPEKAGQPYSAARHLGEMIRVLGPVPRALLKQELEMRHWKWMPEVLNAEGKLCDNVADYYGGPFFSDDGDFLYSDLVTGTRKWEDEAPGCIPEHEKEAFFRFMRRMLCWQPEERPKAGELMNDPWLNDGLVGETEIRGS